MAALYREKTEQEQMTGIKSSKFGHRIVSLFLFFNIIEWLGVEKGGGPVGLGTVNGERSQGNATGSIGSPLDSWLIIEVVVRAPLVPSK